MDAPHPSVARGPSAPGVARSKFVPGPKMLSLDAFRRGTLKRSDARRSTAHVAFVGACLVFGLLLQACDKVEVVSPDPPSVSIAPSAITIDLGERTRLVASVFSTSGSAVGATVTWASSDPGIVSVSSGGEIVGLAVGTVTITARSGGGTGSAQVTVRAPATVVLDRPTVGFTAAPGGVAGPETVEITAPGPDGMSGLAVSITYPSGQSTGWLRTALSSTRTPASLLISADARNLNVGSYTATILIATNGADSRSIAVTLQVTGAPPTLALNSEAVVFAANEAGANPQQQLISISNSGTGVLTSLSLSPIAYGPGEPTGWLTATLGATTALASLALNAVVGSLVQGIYTASVQVISPDAANSPRTIAVTFNVTPPLPIIALNPTTLSFSAVQGGPPPAPQGIAVTNGGIGALNGLQASDVYPGPDIGWIAASLSATSAPSTATVSIDHSALLPGTYSGFVRVDGTNSANSPLLVPVDLTVTPSPVIALSQPTVTFTATAGQADPPAVNVVVTNVGGSVLDGLAVDSILYMGSQPSGWLMGSLNFPLAPSSLRLNATLNPASGPLAPGRYDATVYLGSTAAGVTNSPQQIAVAFFVINTTPVASIATPTTGQIFAGGSPVVLSGTGTDAEDGALSGAALTWASSLDGPLGTGLSVTTSTLSLGTHTITLTATDSQGASATATISISIDSAPTAAITAPADGAVLTLGSPATFTGTGTDPEDGALAGNSLRWTSSVDGPLGSGATLVTTALAAGAHTIRLIAVDTQGTPDTAAINVRVNTPPTANAGPDQTLADADGDGRESVTLDGSASTDVEAPPVSYVWAGTAVPVPTTGVGPTVSLPVGANAITLTVTDSDGATAVDTVLVTVGANTAPTAAITAPAAGSVFPQGSLVNFVGSASDPQDGVLPASAMAWTSSLDGPLGQGASLPTNALTVGAHTITLTATDSGLLTGTASIPIRINAAPVANAGPDQSLIDTNGSGNEPVTLDASGSTDAEASLASYVWTGAAVPAATTGVSPTITLPVGTHTITLTVTDTDGSTATDAVVITIGSNTGPSATITGPAPGAVFQLGALVTFTGSGVDPQDGPLTGTALAWSSSLDGPLGTGSTLATNGLTIGTHTITLTARDAGLLTGTATTTVRINAPPVANAGFDQGLTDTDGSGSEAVTLDGSASNDPDGSLASYSWTGTSVPVPTTGVSPAVTLPVGAHNITLTVTDNDGATAVDVVVVTIGGNSAPTAAITGPASGSVFQVGAVVPLAGTGIDPEEGPLPGSALSWTSSLDGTLGTGSSLPVSGLTAGTHTITLTATDRGLLAGTAVITIRINAAPVANAGADQSLSDSDGSGAESVTLNGSASNDAEGPIAAYSWTGAGVPVPTTGVSPTLVLPVGAYSITLTVTDSDGATDTDVVLVNIGSNTAPSATISAPASGSVFQLGASVPLAGTGSDAEDGSLTGAALSWSSSLDGPLGTGASLPTPSLSAGTHTISLTATDSGLLTGVAAITVRINAPPVANAGPDRNLTDSDGNGTEPVTLNGTASSDAEGPVTYSWTGPGVPVPTTGATPTITLPVGANTIALTVTDSDGATATDAVVVNIGGNTAPTASITGPATGSTFQLGASVTFTGSGTDAEDGPLSGAALGWSSSLDGALGTGASLPTSALTAGTHTITLTATDSGLLTGTTAIVVRVNAPPTANAGADQNLVDNNGDGTEPVTLNGGASTDVEGPVTYSWTGAGVPVPTTGVSPTVTLPVGSTTITLTVTDSDGATAVDAVAINIVSNSAPTATITGPASGSSFLLGASVPLAGTGNDPEDGPLSGTSLTWSSNLDGALGTGTSLPTTALTAGTHTITLTVTDAGGLTGTAAITVTITAPNTAPTATITSPASGSVFPLGASVTLTGTGNDTEDGALTGTSLSWSSSLDGALGTGASLPTSTLTAGTHTITLTATDSGLLTGTAAITLRINAPPTASAGADQNLSDSNGDNTESVTLDGSGSADAEGALTYSWTGASVPVPTTGVSPTFLLPVGTHNITLTVTDSDGATAVDGVVVNVAANTAPVAAITSPAGGASFTQGSSITFTGSGTDPEQGALSGASLVWTSDLDGQIGTGTTFATTALTAGAHTVTLSATDGGGLSGTAMITVTITAVNTPPTAAITSPASGSVFLLGASVPLSGTGNDTEDGSLSGTALTWSSSLDGALGTGASLPTTALTAGTHTITLTATDSGSLTGTAAITVRINTPPSANAGPDQSLSDSNGDNTEAVTLNGAASSDAEGPLTYSWTGTSVPVPTTGATPTIPALPVGTHNITLTVTDGDGATAVDGVVVTVTANTAPVASIGSPADGSSAVQGTQLTFTGSGTDPEQGGLAGASLVWTSDIDGQIGTGATFATSTLALGTHTITLTVTDAGGLTGTAAITVTITAPNTAPTATITSPASGSVFPLGASVTLTGTGNDTEDGALTGTSLSWSSSLDGALGTGASLPTSTLTAGTHTITLTATDSGLLTGTAAITLRINAPPTASAGADQNLSDSNGDNTESVTLDGSGSADAEGALTYSWTGASVPVPTTGVSPTFLLPVGTHNITLTVTDSDGATAVDGVVVNVAANTAPVAAITSPAGGASFTQGSSITFTGSGTDPEQGALSGASLVWTSDLDGQIGTGVTFSNTTLTVGVHTLTLTVTDAGGLTGTAIITVTIT